MIKLNQCPKARGLICLLVMLVLVMTAIVWAKPAIPVTITADGKTIEVVTDADSPEEAVKEAGIVLGAKDEVVVSTASLEAGSNLVVCRAIPVKLAVNGSVQEVYTAKKTVQEAAVQYGYDAEHYIPYIPGTTPVTKDMVIQIGVLTTQEDIREEAIPAPVLREPDAKLAKGEEELVSQGADGRKKVHTTILYADGKEVGRRVDSEEIIAEAVPAVLRSGSRDTVETSRGMERFRRVVRARATAYLPTDGDGRGITATGIRAKYGVVAVDPDHIPLGSRLYVPGYGYAIAADTGGAIIGNRVDLCMEDYQACMEFGVRNVDVYILE